MAKRNQQESGYSQGAFNFDNPQRPDTIPELQWEKVKEYMKKYNLTIQEAWDRIRDEDHVPAYKDQTGYGR